MNAQSFTRLMLVMLIVLGYSVVPSVAMGSPSSSVVPMSLTQAIQPSAPSTVDRGLVNEDTPAIILHDEPLQDNGRMQVQDYSVSLNASFESQFNGTTIFLQICSNTTTIQFRSEKPGVWVSELYVRPIENGCSPRPNSSWRVVIGAVPGESFKIYTSVSNGALSEAQFYQQARVYNCTVTSPGAVSCSQQQPPPTPVPPTPTHTPTPPPTITPSPTLIPIDQGYCGPLDIVFVLDTTRTMRGTLENVASNAAALVDEIKEASGVDYQMGIVNVTSGVTVQVDLAPNNADTILRVLQNPDAMFAQGAIRHPEPSDVGLATVINGLPATAHPPQGSVFTGQAGNFSDNWRPEANKYIILITDAAPSGDDDQFTIGVDDVRARELAEAAAAKGIKIVSIYVPTEFDPANQEIRNPFLEETEAIMQMYAEVTGGVYRRAEPTGSDASAQLRIS
ncbi:MAG: VWA domain-containing protein [Chloroflexaceae bacterium]|nr:VWA domain-containing protein [Chloroflexaceae bacterium]